MGRPRRRMDIRPDSPDLGGIPEALASARSFLRPWGSHLLYRHFDEILDLCAEYGVKLNLTTNGTFPISGSQERGLSESYLSPPT